LFRGATNLTLDVKSRMAIPAKYREVLDELCEGELIVTVSPDARCLWVFPRPEWEKVETKLMALSSFNGHSQRLKRLLMGYAADVTLDGHSRIPIAPALRKFANMEKKVMLIGQGNKFELWDEPHWNQQCDGWLSMEIKEDEIPEEVSKLSL